MTMKLHPEGWKVRKLKDVAEIQRKSIAAGKIESGTKYIGLEHIDSSGSFASKPTVQNGELASTKFMFGSEHLLYGKLRPYLKKIARPNFSGVCSTDILPILPNDGVLDRNYLYYYLRQTALVNLAAARSTGANLPRLSPKTLSEFPVSFPPLAEQKRIAAILDKADIIRRKRQDAIELADTFLRSVFLKMFGDPVTNPMGWEMIPLEHLITVGPQNGLYKPAEDYGTGTQIVRIDSFYSGVIVDYPGLKRVRLSKSEIKRYGLNRNDIIINRVNSKEYLGKSAIIEKVQEPIVFESNMMRFSVDAERVLPMYLVDLLSTPFVKMQINKMRKDAVNQSSINQGDVRAIRVMLPDMNAQQKYAQIKGGFKLLRDRLVSTARPGSDLFSSLQQRAFRGDL